MLSVSSHSIVSLIHRWRFLLSPVDRQKKQARRRNTMTSLKLTWPEPVVRVQSLAQSGIGAIPERYIRPPSSRPSVDLADDDSTSLEIPVIDFGDLFGADEKRREATRSIVSEACRAWGIFQIINHGINQELMQSVRDVWREFFELPAEVKEEYANSPRSYEGYGSRTGVREGAILDWSDYFFLQYSPPSLRNPNKWPALPPSCRKITGEYGEEMMKLCGKVMRVLSGNLGLREEYVERAFGGEGEMGGCLRVNLYPKCPQPELTLGISSHSDPGGLTLLLADETVGGGLQVSKGSVWVTVKPLPNALILNLGDQIQVLSNAIYKSVNHRVIANSLKDRLSLAFFYNPKSDLLIEPAKKLLSEQNPSLYSPMTFDQYRRYIREKGLCGKAQVEALKSPRLEGNFKG